MNTIRQLFFGFILAASTLPAMASGGGGGGFSAPGYMPFDPPFVLNVDAPRGTHFMQITVQAYVETPEDAHALTYHMPAVRNALIMLFSGKSMDEASSVEEREKWRGEALVEVQHVMEELAGTPGTSELFFTDFIVQ